MNVIFTELAKQEMADAIDYYEIEQSGLSNRFSDDIKSAISRIIKYPKAWSVEQGEVRKCLLLKFPYKILYSIESNHILIIAIAHQHRKPDYWIERYS